MPAPDKTHRSPRANPIDDAAWPADAIEVGYVAGAWGIKGAVKVVPQSADASALRSAKRWWLMPGARSIDVVQAKVHGDALVASLQGVDDRNAAEALTGTSVHVSRAAFPRPAKDEFYWVDLVGCEVMNHEGVLLGRVASLLDTGVHSVLRVVAEGAAQDAERLIPFVDAYVGKVDLKARRIEVTWGLDY